jgi:calcineurin-like phosphoesterase family protein
LWALRKQIVCRHINLVFGNHDKNIKKWHRYYRISQSTRTPEIVFKLRQILDDLANGAVTPERARQLANKIEVYNPLEGIFDFIYDYAKVNIDGQEMFLNHFAQAVWDKSSHGVWHLYGHSHANFEPWRETHLNRAKMIDVGIDYRFQLGYGYTPWTVPELSAWMREREGQSVDHHHGDGDNG